MTKSFVGDVLNYKFGKPLALSILSICFSIFLSSAVPTQRPM
ncbi:hypothetical protein VCRA2110O318_20137 [Vibrio crassostreae]|nr:hypothetical protein VCRA2117O328_10287 [Vibrio crassostreae]CAK2317259.1 hypothetical protein VCRA2110O318_20137 [Vibrio crassostreae]CAK2485362.1 hypothetical protein VCRA2110O319_30137 [Vibrio crassostreae]CAK2849938.1 hypothetical protein VCRA217O317_20186 [Vibrio crassostreae]